MYLSRYSTHIILSNLNRYNFSPAPAVAKAFQPEMGECRIITRIIICDVREAEVHCEEQWLCEGLSRQVDHQL